MKKLFLFAMTVVSVMAISGCTSETDDQLQESAKVTKIMVGTQDALDTKTNTNASSSSVTWASGDEIILFHVNGSGRSDYKTFVLQSGAGNQTGYFGAKTESDALTPGQSYKIIYPASAVQYTESSPYACTDLIQSGSGTTSHLASYDWLYSVAKQIPEDGVTPSFTLLHSMALAKITLHVSTPSTVGNIESMSISRSGNPIFASSVYLDDNLDFKVKTNYTKVAVVISGQPAIKNGTFYVFWFPLLQTASTTDVTFYAIWSAPGSTSTNSATYIYTTGSSLQAGYLYDFNMNLTLSSGNGSGTLTMQ